MKKNVLLEHLYHQPPIDVNELVPYLQGLAEKIRPMVADTTHFLYQANKEGKTILLEGQLGSLRDPDHGIYPYTTSSSPLAGYGCVGAGVSPRDMTDIVCVTKAYSSCVGAGAFVSKLDGAAGDELRRRGGDAANSRNDRPCTRCRLVRRGGDALRCDGAGRDAGCADESGRAGLSGRDSGVRCLRSGRQADTEFPATPTLCAASRCM